MDAELGTTAAAALVSALSLAGTERVYGQPGVHNLAAWFALDESPIRVVGVRHEQTAVYAADGEARVTGRVGVAMTTTGPAAANALAATGEAWASGSPVLVIATDIPASLRRAGEYRGVLHENRDQAGMFAPVTKATLRARTADDVAPLTRLALRIAGSAPTRPVYLEVPTDLLGARIATPATGEPEHHAQASPVPDRATCERVAAALVSAERPLIWAGGGALRSGSGADIARLAGLIGAPVIETYQARGLVSLDHPSKVAVTPHAPEIGSLWDEADAVLAVGTDFDGMMTQNWALPQPPWLGVINLDPADGAKAYPPDELIAADARDAVRCLLACLDEVRPRAVDPAALREGIRRREHEARAAAAAECPGAAAFLATIAGLGPEVIVVADMCIAGYWLAGYHPVAAPRRFSYPMGWGTLGSGFPSAIGAALASELPVVAVVGDGGFLFACGELAVLAQERVPLTVVIVDDGGYGMLRYDQERLGRRPVGVDLTSPDFAAVATAFGIRSRTVADLDDALAGALAEALAAREPNVIVARAALTPPLSTSPRWYRRN